MRVHVRGPWPREVHLPGPLLVREILAALHLGANAATVVRADYVLPLESTVADDDTVEVICVVEGGSAPVTGKLRHLSCGQAPSGHRALLS